MRTKIHRIHISGAASRHAPIKYAKYVCLFFSKYMAGGEGGWEFEILKCFVRGGQIFFYLLCVCGGGGGAGGQV